MANKNTLNIRDNINKQTFTPKGKILYNNYYPAEDEFRITTNQYGLGNYCVHCNDVFDEMECIDLSSHYHGEVRKAQLLCDNCYKVFLKCTPQYQIKIISELNLIISKYIAENKAYVPPPPQMATFPPEIQAKIQAKFDEIKRRHDLIHNRDIK